MQFALCCSCKYNNLVSDTKCHQWGTSGTVAVCASPTHCISSPVLAHLDSLRDGICYTVQVLNNQTWSDTVFSPWSPFLLVYLIHADT